MAEPQNPLFFRKNWEYDKDTHAWNFRQFEAWVNAPKDLAQLTGNLNATGGVISGTLYIPAATGWRLELNNPDYIAVYWDGSERRFSLDEIGALYASEVQFGTASRLLANDVIEAPSTTAPLTPAVVQSATNVATNATTVSKAFTSSTTAGNLLVVAVSWTPTTRTISSGPSGFTAIGSPVSNTGGIVTQLYYKANCGAAESAPSVTMSGTCTVLEIAVLEASGVAATTPADRNASSGTGSTSAPQTGTTAITTQGYEFWIGAIGSLAGGTQSAPTNGFTKQNEALSGAFSLGLYTRQVTATSTANVGATTPVASAYAGKVATFKAASSTISTPAAGKSRLHVLTVGSTTQWGEKRDDGVDQAFATPAGVIQMFGGSSAPTGWLMCDGSAVSRTTYAALFAVVGTAFGTGDGSTTFNLPNLADRAPVGTSGTKALGSTGSGGGGSHTHGGGSYAAGTHSHNAGSLASQNHDHTSGTLVTGAGSSSVTKSAGGQDASDKDHNHNITGSTANSGGLNVTGSTGSDAGGSVSGTSGSGSVDTTPPYQALAYIIHI